MTDFCVMTLTGEQAAKFLQGQVTCHVDKLNADIFQPTAISNLKGRVEFGLWLKRIDDMTFEIVLSADCVADFAQHIKKYGAFSKITLSDAKPIYPVVIEGVPTFSETDTGYPLTDWQTKSIAQGNYWLTQPTRGLFQPQELRLHQRGGVDYDKGCYLGQEIIARLWFKASPKAWLHRIAGTGDTPDAGAVLGNNVTVVNAIAKSDSANAFEALVIARPDDIAAASLTVLALPEALQQPIERQV